MHRCPANHTHMKLEPLRPNLTFLVQVPAADLHPEWQDPSIHVLHLTLAPSGDADAAQNGAAQR